MPTSGCVSFDAKVCADLFIGVASIQHELGVGSVSFSGHSFVGVGDKEWRWSINRSGEDFTLQDQGVPLSKKQLRAVGSSQEHVN